MLKVGEVKEIYELKGAGRRIREIARELDVSRNTVRRYLKSPEALRPKPRPMRGSKLDPYTEHIDRRMGEGLSNCRVLDREVEGSGLRKGATPRWCSTCDPGGGVLSLRRRYGSRLLPGNRRRWTGGASPTWMKREGGGGSWAFVMVLSWSRAIYVEFVRRADTASFHPVPPQCL